MEGVNQRSENLRPTQSAAPPDGFSRKQVSDKASSAAIICFTVSGSAVSSKHTAAGFPLKALSVKESTVQTGIFMTHYCS